MSTHKADTFGIAFGTRRLAEGIIGGLHDLAEHVGADVREGDTPEAVMSRIKHRIYKDTSCGCVVVFCLATAPTRASIHGEPFMVQVRGACEGVNYHVDALQWYSMIPPVPVSEWDTSVAQADQNGQTAWNATHGCEGCGEIDPESGHRRVREDCPNCGGQGIVL